MKRKLFCIFACMGLAGQTLVQSAVLADLKNPSVSGGGVQYYTRNGGVQLTDSPFSRTAAIASIPLGKRYSPGSYQVYFKLENVKSSTPMECGLGGHLRLVQPVNTGGKYLGPIAFNAESPFDSLKIRSSVNLRITGILLTDSAENNLLLVSPPPLKRRNAFQVQWPDSVPYPYWFQKGEDIFLEYNSIGDGKGMVEVILYDYMHEIISRKKSEIFLGSRGKLKLPNPEKFGIYLARVRVICENGESIDMQKIFAILSPSLPKPSVLLGGHGKSALLQAMGAGWERLWDSNGSLLWKSIEREKGRRDWRQCRLPPVPLKPIVVIDGFPKWMQNYYENPAELLNFAGELAARFKGRAEVYEIFNEPYGVHRNPGAAKHVEMVGKIAAEIRRADPSAKVAVGGPPEEIPPGLEWWEIMAKNGLFQHADLITGHFYVGAGGTHPLDQDVRLDAYLVSVKRLLKRFGQEKKKLVDSESGLCPMETFYLGNQPEYGLWGARGFSSRTPVPYLTGTPMAARLFLIHAFHRVPWILYHTDASYGNSWAFSDGDGTPLPAAVVIAQAVRFLQNTQPAGRLELPAGYFGVSLKRGTEMIVPFWAVNLKLGEKRLISSSSWKSVRLFDMFCNPLFPTGNQLEIGMNPVYVTGEPLAVKNFFADMISKSVFEKGRQSFGRLDQLVSRKGNCGFRVVAPESADGCSMEVLHDENTLSSGGKKDSWMAVSGNKGKPFSILYEWNSPQRINWITVGWAMGYLPEKYKVEWFDGVNWHCAQGTWNGWRKPNQNVESYPVWEFKTSKLRLSLIPRNNVNVRVSEFAAIYAPRLTPPVTEMQEIYNLDFKPHSDGFLSDWLICGPFPANGNRFTKKTPPLWNEMLLKNHYHYGRQYDDVSIRPKVDFCHFVTFQENPNTKWFVGKGTVHWVPLHSRNGYVDFAQAFQGTPVHAKPLIIENCYGYAVCYITLEKPFQGLMGIGSDDGYKVMIGDKVIAQKIIYRSAGTDQEKYPVSIPAGTHRILVRVHNDINGHGFRLRFLNRDGSPFLNYTVRIVP